MFVDSGAEISCMPRRCVPHEKLIPLERPVRVAGFRNNDAVEVTHRVEISIFYRPGVLKASFYVVDTPFPIIGTDLLYDRSKRISLVTGREAFRVGDEMLFTKPDPLSSKEEYKRRKFKGPQSYGYETRRCTNRLALMRATKRAVIPPRSIVDVDAYIDEDGWNLVTDEHTLISRFLNEKPDDDGLFIPCITWEDKETNYRLPVENATDHEMILDKDFIFGDIQSHPRDNSNDDFEVFPLFEVLAEIKEREKRKAEKYETESVHNAKTPTFDKTVSSATVDETLRDAAPTSGPDEEAVKFSTLVGRDKVDAATLDRCRDKGVEFDLDIEQPPPEVEVELIDDVDIEGEAAKAKDCPYWTDREAFLAKFNLKDMQEEHVPKVQDLLWKFRHVFYNESTPQQFHLGIKAKPIKIERKPGMTPRKEKVRTMSDKKLSYLKKHIEEMVDQQVLEELVDVTDCHASPAHIVLERRFVASQNSVVFKSRFTADLRELNKCLPDSSFPLPNCDQFRRECAAKGFTVFSNFDCSSFFYQFKIDKESARKNFGVYALGRIYIFLRLAMGCKISPSVSQAIIDRCFRCHDHCRPFLDDLTLVSTSIAEHLDVDLPKMLAICSYYNILLKPTKCDIIRPDCRILGHQVSQESMTLSAEKIEKIEQLAFPSDKKDLISKLAFFQYFMRIAPRLSELTASLRRLAVSKVRFRPEPHHVEDFEAAKKHLLDEQVNCIRMPSQDPRDTIVLWTDASANSISCLVTQMLEPLELPVDGLRKKRLYIVGCFSSVIKPGWVNYPIWLLELLAFSEATRKFSFLLCGRAFFVCTDSRTTQYFASLDLVPKSLCRRIMALQKFEYRLIFVESRINPADCLSRLQPGPAPVGEYPRFLRARIFNSRGEPVPWQKLFSHRKSEEAREFFQRSCNQSLSTAADLPPPDEDEEEEDDGLLFAPDHELEEPSKPSALLEPEVARDVYATVSAIDLNDEEMESGENEILEEDDLDDPFLEGVSLPTFNDERLEEVRRMQNDETLEEIRDFIGGKREIPGKHEALGLNLHLRYFLRNRSLFRVSPQGVLFRLWTTTKGETHPLIVVGAAAFRKLIGDVHSFTTEGDNRLCHIGRRKTMLALEKTYYAFEMRKTINDFISKCAICRLNSHPISSAESTGAMMGMEPNETFVVDFWGPIKGFAQTASGRPRYVFVAVDLFSKFLITQVTNGVDDNEVMKSLLHLRRQLNGFPRRIQADNAIFTPKSRSLKFLKTFGVEVTHGLAHVSRCQSTAERMINTLTRLVTKYHTAEPSTSFDRLVEEATICVNNSPAEGLPPGAAPKDVHFVRPPVTFLRTVGDDDKDDGSTTIGNAIRAARVAERDAQRFTVRSYMKRGTKESPTNYTRKLKPGDLALKKRSSFPTHSPKKLSYKLDIDGFLVKDRVATNSFRCESVISGQVCVLPGDMLIKVKGFTRDTLADLVRSMELASLRGAASVGRRKTRARTNVDSISRQMFVVIGESVGAEPFEDLASTNCLL